MSNNKGDAFFRANAGALVVNGQGRVLALRRRGTPEEAWQMPQGGIAAHETPLEAAWRELGEETGLTAEQVELVGASADWVVYELPQEYRSQKVGWGQVQRWFAYRVRRDVDVRPDGKEFDAHSWLTPNELLTRVVSFRRAVYRRVFDEFAYTLGQLA